MRTAFFDVVDGYAPVVAGLTNDVDEVEDSLFGEKNADPALSERIYRLLSQVVALQRAIGPLPDMVRGLLRGAGRTRTQMEAALKRAGRKRGVAAEAVRIRDVFRAD